MNQPLQPSLQPETYSGRNEKRRYWLSTAELVEYSRKGARIRQAPFLQKGNEITIHFETDSGQRLTEQGIIRSCQKDNDSARAIIGVELDFPLQLFQEHQQSSSVS